MLIRDLPTYVMCNFLFQGTYTCNLFVSLSLSLSIYLYNNINIKTYEKNQTCTKQLLILLTDVGGVYDKPPTNPDAKVHAYTHTRPLPYV